MPYQFALLATVDVTAMAVTTFMILIVGLALYFFYPRRIEVTVIGPDNHIEPEMTVPFPSATMSQSDSLSSPCRFMTMPARPVSGIQVRLPNGRIIFMEGQMLQVCCKPGTAVWIHYVGWPFDCATLCNTPA